MAEKILCVGGGMVGLLGAIALARQGFHVALLEKNTLQAMQQPKRDGRTVAIAHGSACFMQEVGVWEDIAPHACPIHHIHISDGKSTQCVDYDYTDVGSEPLGYIVENNLLLAALYETALQTPTLTIHEKTTVKAWKSDGFQSEITTQEGDILTAPLVIAADGKHSPLRKMAHLAWVEKPYTQAAIVCTVTHEKPHKNVAQERFLTAGPFAILPMQDDDQGRHRSSLVWTEKASLISDFIALSRPAFLSEIAWRFTDFLGEIALASDIFSYPLFYGYAPQTHASRLLLVGDAAHVIHPIAGQGANLGFRDWQALVPMLVAARNNGGDVGSPALLAYYHQKRQFDVQSMLSATDGLNHLFSNSNPVIASARRLGLTAVQHLPPLKKILMRHAMGVV